MLITSEKHVIKDLHKLINISTSPITM